SCSVTTRVTSGWVPASVVTQLEHSPQPARWHCNVAANARATTERPEPGGPTINHACVIAADRPPSTAAGRNVGTTVWPTTASQTLTGRPPAGAAQPRLLW